MTFFIALLILLIKSGLLRHTTGPGSVPRRRATSCGTRRGGAFSRQQCPHSACLLLEGAPAPESRLRAAAPAPRAWPGLDRAF